jgi:hypothetical protein
MQPLSNSTQPRSTRICSSRLYPEQWLILTLLTIFLGLGIDWELPDPKRAELLSGTDLSPGQVERISALTRSYFQEREAEDADAIRKQRGGERPEKHRATVVGSVLSEDERLRALRRFVLGSAAVDERKPFIALARMNPAKLDLDPRGFMYGGAYLYPTGAILFLLERTGVLETALDLDFHLRHPSNVALMYLAGRGLSLVGFLGTAAMLALLGELFRNRAAGTLAMLTWSFSTLPLNQALVSKPHVWAAFWLTTGLYWLVRYRNERRGYFLLLSALTAGLGVGSSFPSGVMLLIYPIALLSRREWRPALATTSLVLLGVAVVFLATNPYLALSYEKYLLTLGYHESFTACRFAKAIPYLHRVVDQSYCWPVSILGIGYVLLRIVRGDELERRLAFVLTGIVLLISFTLANARISLFVGPLFCLARRTHNTVRSRRAVHSPLRAGRYRRRHLVRTDT